MLNWDRLPDGSAVMAIGRDCVYLVVGRPGAATLTRVSARPKMTPTEAAVQASQNAIHIHPKAGGDALGSDLRVAREIAQDFEDGEDIFGHPAWQQGG